MNKPVRNIIILVAALAVLCGAMWWVLTVEPKDDSQPGTTSDVETYTVYETEESNIVAVEIKTDETLSFARSGEMWTMLSGVDHKQLSQAKIKSLVTSLSKLTSTNKVTESVEECGFDSPTAVVTITLSDGKRDIITIGAKSPVLGQYFSRVNDGEIYMLSSYKVEDIMEDAAYYTSFSRLDIVGDDVFDIKIERAKNTVHLEMSENSNTFNAWCVTSPYKDTYSANDQYVQEQILSKLDALEISTLATDANTGLSSPQAVLTVKSAPLKEDGTREEATVSVIKIGNRAGDITYVEYEGTAYETATRNLDFINVEEFLLLSRQLALTPIQSLNSVRVKGNSGEYLIEVSHSNMGADDDEMTFKINGTPSSEKKTKTTYQEIIGIAAESEYKNEPLGTTIAEIEFNSAEGKKVITFSSINEMSAAYTINGATEFTLKKTAVEKMLAAVAELANSPQ